MPRTIYERRKTGITYPDQRPDVPIDYVYIGDGVQSNQPPFAYVPVYNRANNAWLWINNNNLVVDYTIDAINWNSARGTITDWNDPDFRSYTFTITPVDGAGTPIGAAVVSTLADDTYDFPITGLNQQTRYRTNLVANLDGGVTTNDSIQYFTTPLNPTPPAPVLTYTAASNTDIDLAWTDSPGTTAVKYRVYAGVGWGAPWAVGNNGIDVQPTANRAWKAIWLAADTPYYYQVAGINASGMEGPKSNRVQVHTGHEARITGGEMWGEYIQPSEWGSWRPDIGWKLWYARSRDNTSIYQGYWQGDPAITGPTPITIPSQESGRYWGTIVYDCHGFRVYCDQRYGSGVWQNLNITRAEIVKVYRMRAPGNYLKQYMLWHVTNADPFGGGRPPIIASHRNNYNNEDAVASQDAMAAGTYIENLRLPRSFGRALVASSWWGTPCNGILLHRGDHENNGYGTAGYGEWSGHGARDRSLSDAWRVSDWRIRVSGNWNFQSSPRVAPYPW